MRGGFEIQHGRTSLVVDVESLAEEYGFDWGIHGQVLAE